MLSKCIDWFEVQEESNATQVAYFYVKYVILLLKKLENQKNKLKWLIFFFYNMCGMYVYNLLYVSILFFFKVHTRKKYNKCVYNVCTRFFFAKFPLTVYSINRHSPGPDSDG